MPKRRGNGEGTIGLRADGRWGASLMIEGRRIQVYGKTRKEAQGKLEAAKVMAAQGLRVEAQRWKVEDLLRFWLKEVATPNTRASSVAAYTSRINHHLLPTIGKVPLLKLTPQHVIKMQNDLMRQGKTAQTVKMARAILCMALKQAMAWQLVSRNVATLVAAPAVESVEHYTPTMQEIGQLIAATENTWENAFIRTAALMGLRSCELRALRWSDIDVEKNILDVRAALGHQPNGPPVFLPVKTTSSRRSLPMPGVLVRVLRLHRAEQLRYRMEHADSWHHYDLVFPTQDGVSMSAIVVLRIFRNICTRAGLPRMRLHDLRHANATMHSERGTPMRATMELMGHSNIQVTQQVYTHAHERGKRDAVDGLASDLEELIEGIKNTEVLSNMLSNGDVA